MGDADVRSATELSAALQCLEVRGGHGPVGMEVAVSGINAWIYSEPFHGDHLGGDVYFVSMCGGGRISRFCLADVAGHGYDAASLAKRLRWLMRRHVNKIDQRRFARALNREFSRHSSRGRFATALLATYFAPTKNLIICNIGSPTPYWYHAASKSWDRLVPGVAARCDKVRNVPLGVIDQTKYEQFAVELEPEDIVVISSDWLTEARNEAGEHFGEERLFQKLRDLDASSPESIVNQLLDAIAGFTGASKPADDQTILVLHHNAEDPPRQSVRQRIVTMFKMLGYWGATRGLVADK